MVLIDIFFMMLDMQKIRKKFQVEKVPILQSNNYVGIISVLKICNMQYPSIEIFFFIAMASEKKIEFFSGKSRYFIGFDYIGAIGIENNPIFKIIT